MMQIKSRKMASRPSEKEVVKKMNPFEVHINRSKHQVLGQKLKSDRGLPGISKNKALQKRKKTLLQEYKFKNKSNNFIDKRIGERNTEMTEDDRIMARFAAERMRRFNKKTMFNLSDTEVLTHRGQTLSEIEKFEDTRSDDDEDEHGTSGTLKGKFVESAHFGGGTLQKTNKDRESLIEELINESKRRKAERQRTKEETLEATEQLDEEWKTLGMVVTSASLDSKSEDIFSTQKNDQYDVVMRQLKFEPQGQASQRLKTDEETAKEEKEQLENFENERLKLLKMTEVNKVDNHRSADDLDDGSSYFFEDINDDSDKAEHSESASESNSEDDDIGSEEETEVDPKNSTIGKNKKEIGQFDQAEFEKNTDSEENLAVEESIENEDTSCVSSSEHEQESPANLSEESSDGECAMDDLTDLMPDMNEKRNTDSPSSSNAGNISAQSDEHLKAKTLEEYSFQAEIKQNVDLPFVINGLKSSETFKASINEQPSQLQNKIFERLITNNQLNLEPGNKEKMLASVEFIFHYIAEEDVSWEVLPTLARKFILAKEINIGKNLKLFLDAVSLQTLSFHGDLLPRDNQTRMKFLALYIIVFLSYQRTNEFEVIKPALSLACSVISKADPLSVKERVIAFLFCDLLLQVAKHSAILYTDVITFLHKCLEVLKSRIQSKGRIQSKVNGMKTENAHLSSYMQGVGFGLEYYFFPRVIDLLYGFIKAYKKYPESKILFEPIKNIFDSFKVAKEHPWLCNPNTVAVCEILDELQMVSLPPLLKAAKKPKALRQYEPAFHAVTVGKFNKGLPAEKVEQQKLLHKYKQEMKGAIRELRRDSAFLANIKLTEKAQSDEQRKRKVKEIYGAAAAQQGELRSLKRKK